MLDFGLIFVAIIGLLFGSFMNVLIYRMPRELSFSKGRSMCPNCKNTLKFYDLIPVFSYLFLGGKCRKCKAKISIRYPLVEVTTSFMFSILYMYIQSTLGGFRLEHTLLFIILYFALFGVFTDFIYHGVFDISNMWILGLFVVYSLISTGSVAQTIQSFVGGISYLIPILLIVLYISLKNKGKFILSIMMLLLTIVLSFVSLIYFNIDVMWISNLFPSLVVWFSLSLILFIADYTINKFINCKKLALLTTNVTQFVTFVGYFVIIFALNPWLLGNENLAELIKSPLFYISVILFIMFYVFMDELSIEHDNDEEVLDSNEEVLDREENIFTQYIGDGDIFILPLIGMILGAQNVLNFFALMAFTVTAVYFASLRKGSNYSVPLYPYMFIATIFLI